LDERTLEGETNMTNGLFISKMAQIAQLMKHNQMAVEAKAPQGYDFLDCYLQGLVTEVDQDGEIAYVTKIGNSYVVFESDVVSRVDE
jgi:hypothetical protein